MKTWTSTLLAGLILAVNSIAFAQSVPEATFEDQWEKQHKIAASTKWLVISQAMESGDIVKAAFNNLELKSPQQYQMLYIADISGMPSFISNMFAIPKMKDYIFPIGLIREEEQLKSLKVPLDVPEKVAVIALDNLNIDGAVYFSDQKTFETFLKQEVIK